MVTRVVSIDFTTTGASKVTRALGEITSATKSTAASTSVASGAVKKSAGEFQTAFTQLGSTQAKLFNPLKSGLGGIGKALDDAGLSATALGGSFLAGAGAATVAVTAYRAVKTQLLDVINAAREQEKQNRITNAVLTSTGGIANVTADDVTKLATALSRQTGVQDEVIQGAENILLTFTSVRNEVGKGNDVFNQATQAALDLSTVLGADLPSSAKLIGKALQDPVGSLTQLRRAGVNIDVLKPKIEALVAAGDKLGAQKAILKELFTEFGGAAAAAADPISKLGVSVNELKESLGKDILPTVDFFVSGMTRVLDVLASTDTSVKKLNLNKPGDFLKGVGKVLFEGPIGIFDEMQKKAPAAAEAINTLRDAQAKLANDTASHASSAQLAADRDAVSTATTRATAVTNALTGATQGETAAQVSAADAAQKHADAMNALFDAQNQLLGGENALANSENSVKKAYQDRQAAALQVFATHGSDAKALQDLTDKNLSLKDAVLQSGEAAATNAQNQEKLREARSGEADSLSKAQAAEKQAAAGHRAEIAELEQLKQRFPELSSIVDHYIATLNSIPATKHTDVTVSVSQQLSKQPFIDAPGFASPHRRASGGPVEPSKRYLVGEKEPELFIPKRNPNFAKLAAVDTKSVAQGVPNQFSDERSVMSIVNWLGTPEGRNYSHSNKSTGPTVESGAHLVGGRGPEFFVPTEPGDIIPGDALRQIAKQAKNFSVSPESPSVVSPDPQYLKSPEGQRFLKEKNLIAGARASGGPVEIDRAYLVGENGPELFVPKQDGQIVSHEVLAHSRPVSSVPSSGGDQSSKRAEEERGLKAELDSVRKSAQGLSDDEYQLSQARKDQKQSTEDLTTAYQNYETVLHGVAANSREAADAVMAFAQAQNSAAQATLDVGSATRNLAQVKNDLPLLRFAVQDAQTKLARDLDRGADPETIARDRIALRDAQIEAASAADRVKAAELQLSDARLNAEQRTRDLKDAEHERNGVLHGFAKTSQEAKDAQQQLNDAYRSAIDSLRQLIGLEKQLAAAKPPPPGVLRWLATPQAQELAKQAKAPAPSKGVLEWLSTPEAKRLLDFMQSGSNETHRRPSEGTSAERTSERSPSREMHRASDRESRSASTTARTTERSATTSEQRSDSHLIERSDSQLVRAIERITATHRDNSHVERDSQLIREVERATSTAHRDQLVLETQRLRESRETHRSSESTNRTSEQRSDSHVERRDSQLIRAVDRSTATAHRDHLTRETHRRESIRSSTATIERTRTLAPVRPVLSGTRSGDINLHVHNHGTMIGEQQVQRWLLNELKRLHIDGHDFITRPR